MAILGIDDFKSKLSGGGARPSLFKATVNFPTFVESANVELASFLCKQATIPDSTVGVIPISFRGRKLNLAGDRVFTALTLTIINDAEFDVRKAFEQWMNGINQHQENTGLVDMNDYSVDVVVEQLRKDGTTSKRYDFRGCWPSSLAAIDLNYETNDTIEDFTVELQVQYWESDTTS
jgi:hypothetical protein|tara:strand:- start:169 stop:699 length:531 start_codon:yes stop_codon:yes gene_type:complete